MGLSEDDIQFIEESLKEPYKSIEKYEEFFISKLQMHTALCTTAIAAAKRNY